jgi:hypothetical protein
MLLLRNLWHPQGVHAVGDAIVHYAAPLLFLIDWVVFVPRQALRPSDALTWLAYPFVYAAYTLAHGALSGFYPYPFLDAAALGHPAVLVNMAWLGVGFLALGLGIVVVDRLGPVRR